VDRYIELLMELSDAFGPSGFEDDVRELIINRISALGYSYTVDRRGNLIAIKKGEGNYRVIVDAHMDEVGFMVKYISERGFIQLVPIGGYDDRILPGHIVKFKTDGTFVEGVFSTLPPHVLTQEERSKPLKLDKLWVDIGANSKEEILKKGISPGTPGVIHYNSRKMGNKIMGKAFDDRAGCAVLLYLMEELKDVGLPYDIVFAFATQEEVGLKGAHVIKEQYEGDIALIFEGTLATDIEGVSEKSMITRAGFGPALTLMDRSVIPSHRLLRFIEKIAERNNIPYQYKMPGVGGTDGGAYGLKNMEVAVIAVPARNIHSPTSLIDVNDFTATLTLAKEVILALPEYLNRER